MSNEMILKIIDTKIAEYESTPKRTKSTEGMYDLRNALMTEMRNEYLDAEEVASIPRITTNHMKTSKRT